MIGKTFSHYKILEQLGAGGMGVGYKIKDIILKHIVASKFLPHEPTRNPDAKKHFMRHAKTASALVLYNIINIHKMIQIHGKYTFLTVMTFNFCSFYVYWIMDMECFKN